MKPSFTAFQLPVATATERVAAIVLPTQAAWSAETFTTPRPATQQEHKVRTLASANEHRAQFLAQRRIPVRTSAKRW